MFNKNLLEQPDLFQFLFANHPDGICIVDANGHFLYVNVTIATMLGYSNKELLQTTLDQLIHSTDRNNGSEKSRLKLTVKHKKGDLVYLKLTSIPLGCDGKEMGSFIRFENITHQMAQIQELSDTQEMFTLITEKSQNIISSISADGVFTYISPTVKELLGFEPEEVIGKAVASFNHPDTNAQHIKHRNSLVIDQDTVRFTGQVRHKNGEYRWYETTAEYIRDQFGNIVQTIGVGRDITERKEAEEKVMHLAYHDSVTDLPNRRLFKSKVSQLLDGSSHDMHCLMLLDLDGFKFINDTFGHDIGDQLLIEVAKRLSHEVGDKGFVARWGGDEFTILLSHIEKNAEITSLNSRIKNSISEPILIAGHSLSINVSIGVSFSKEDGNTVDELLKKADAAMYNDKNQTKIN